MRRLFVASVVLVVALAVAAAAPAANRRPHGAHHTTLALAAVPSGLRFDKTVLTASVGVVTIVMSNHSPLLHDVAIKGNGVNAMGKIVQTGGTSVVTATLKAGSYEFYCSVPGHEQAGMKGTLVVR